MPSFDPQLPNSSLSCVDRGRINSCSVPDFESFEQSDRFHLEDAFGVSGVEASSTVFVPESLLIDSLGKIQKLNTRSLDSSAQESQKFSVQNPAVPTSVFELGGNTEDWGDSNMADTSPRTDGSTDADTNYRDERSNQGQSNAVAVSDSSDRSKDKLDQKTLRRLAQNREAARKSRLRKKAYVQQLESSRMKLTQIEQELQRARQQGIFISSSGDHAQSLGGNGAMAFDAEYGRWLEEKNRQITELSSAITSHASDSELRTIVEGLMAHYEELFRLKSNAAKNDVFHLLSGMWKTPAERCFLWLGGFRSSELLKLVTNQLEPLTESQSNGLISLQESSQQAEDALSQGMDALQQSLAETVSHGILGSSGSSGHMANYMGQMAMAMGKLGTLEGFIRQADNLRLQTLQQMHRILTIRQSARALLAIHDYFTRLRALSSLWLARPRQ